MAIEQESLKLVRRSVPRPRTGCITCKKRHVKCDEARPACRRCVSSKRTCDGYTTGPEQPSSTVLRINISSYIIPFKIPGGQKERRAFHYYCVRGNNDICGWIKSEFWTQTVLQYSHQVPAIRQSLIALSFAHLERTASDCSGPIATSESVEAIYQYTKAMTQLRKFLSTDRPSKVVVLICCLLLFAFQGVQGDFEGGMKHLENGLRILRVAEQEEAARALTSEGQIVAPEGVQLKELDQIFTRHFFHASSHDDRSHWEINHDLRLCVVPADHTFDNLVEAQITGIKIANLSFSLHDENKILMPYDQLPGSITQYKLTLYEQFHNWTDALSNFLLVEEQNHPLEGLELERIRCAAMSLRLLHMSVFMAFKYWAPWDPNVYAGPYNADIEEVLDLCTTLLDREHIPGTVDGDSLIPKTGGRTKIYCSEVGVLVPLFTLAIHTTDAEYYRRTLVLLRRAAHRREGLRDGQEMLDVLARVKGLVIPSAPAGTSRTELNHLTVANLAARRALRSEGPAYSAWALLTDSESSFDHFP